MNESCDKNDNLDKNKKIIFLAFKKTNNKHPGLISRNDAETFVRILNGWETKNGRKGFKFNISEASRECAMGDIDLLTAYRSLGANFFNLRKKVENGEDVDNDETESTTVAPREDTIESKSTFDTVENQRLAEETLRDIRKLFD